MLRPPSIPGLFITGTDTDVGKTVITGAIGNWFHRRTARVGVCKPVATGCVRQREGLVSEDAEFLASTCHARHPLDLICPQRYAEPLAPAIAAERARTPIEWPVIDNALQFMARDSDLMLVEGAGGALVPMDERTFVLDMIRWLGLPTVVVARAGLGTINHTLLTVAMLRAAGVDVAGVVINRYNAASPSVAEEINPGAIERWGGVPVLCVVPETPVRGPVIPVDVAAAIDLVDWARFARMGRPITGPIGSLRLR
ncbi:MAG: dethiobiotin synthase [Tepidisphaeraceae bacterium]